MFLLVPIPSQVERQAFGITEAVVLNTAHLSAIVKGIPVNMGNIARPSSTGRSTCLSESMACLQDLEAGSIYGLEKLWAFFHYGPGIHQDSAVQLTPKVSSPIRTCSAQSVWLLQCSVAHFFCAPKSVGEGWPMMFQPC